MLPLLDTVRGILKIAGDQSDHPKLCMTEDPPTLSAIDLKWKRFL